MRPNTSNKLSVNIDQGVSNQRIIESSTEKSISKSNTNLKIFLNIFFNKKIALIGLYFLLDLKALSFIIDNNI